MVAAEAEEAEEAEDTGRDDPVLANTTAVAEANVAATGDLEEKRRGRIKSCPSHERIHDNSTSKWETHTTARMRTVPMEWEPSLWGKRREASDG